MTKLLTLRIEGIGMVQLGPAITSRDRFLTYQEAVKSEGTSKERAEFQRLPTV